MAAPEGGRQDASGHWGDRLPPHQVHREALSAALQQQSVLFVPLGDACTKYQVVRVLHGHQEHVHMHSIQALSAECKAECAMQVLPPKEAAEAGPPRAAAVR